ncbi:NADH:flavin oxidoreductase/NADH oxidase [Candidatus Halobonum tyrrellensis]|uniref:NADH:flavin oxidoreductase n=1 Tax=Candidatus Halobonum tyrrellensis G22 TaxID=1324957 RepID=V4HI65_9EURY|nr:NADH:flavin oxidoreductase/NADH oxidase [Candidatus Halobonum tyrrellensis]ESP89453.1 NADH:flavin oxidoreductase [Candidatus Halobonum tyrrellensis G22]
MVDTLFSSLSIRGTELPNRVMVSPMCQYSSSDGLATDWHLVHLGSRAVGGAGLVMAEATAVTPEGRITPYDLGIWNDEQADALAPVADFVRSQGSVPAIQLAHAGRKASTGRPWDGGDPVPVDEGGWETVAPSGTPYPRDGDEQPTRALSTGEIEDVVADFADAAERALAAGFEVAEVHAAHGYLLHEFLSPVANDRDDEYGGSFENRTRLLREVTGAVRSVWPDDKPVFVRISATDWLDDRESWDVGQSARLAPLLAEAGADLVDVSSGGISPDQQLPHAGPNYQLPYAETIKEHVEAEDADVLVGSVGGITEPQQAEAIVSNGRADAVLMAREFLRSPYWPLHAAHELGAEVEWPVQYQRAAPR